MKVGVLGTGEVGRVLSEGFLRKGHEVMRGTRDPAKLKEWRHAAGHRARVGSFAEAAAYGAIVVLAVKGAAAEAVIGACGSALDGKVVIDTTNPIAEAPPTAGVLSFFTGPNDSLLERLQRKAPGAQLVKAFSCVGSALMVDPKLKGGRPTMFICGDETAARQHVADLLDTFGWDVEDLGAAAAARAIEPLCMLWCIPGFLRSDWAHAFKLLRP